MKKIIFAFICLLFYTTNFAQHTCSSPQPFSSSKEGCVGNEQTMTTSPSEDWYGFVANSSGYYLDITNPSLANLQCVLYALADTSNVCGSLIPLDTLNMSNIHDTFDLNYLVLGTIYLLKIDYPDASAGNTYTICSTEKTNCIYWQNNFYATCNSPTEPLLNSFTSASSSQNCLPIQPNSGTVGNQGQDTVVVCLNDTLHLEILDYYVDGFGITPGPQLVDFYFLDQNGALVDVSNPYNVSLSFSNTGFVTFLFVLDGYYPNLGVEPNFQFTVQVISDPTTIPGFWAGPSTICPNQSTSFAFQGPCGLNSVNVDGIPVPFTNNLVEISGTNFSVGTHTLNYTVVTPCGNASFQTSFTILPEFVVNYTVSPCGLLTINQSICDISNGYWESIYLADIPNDGYLVDQITSSFSTITQQYPLGSWNIPYELYHDGILVYSANIVVNATNPTTLISGPQYACEIGTGTYCLPTTSTWTSIVWNVPAGYTYAGAGTTCIDPTNDWGSSGLDVPISVSAVGTDGCTYTASFSALACCKQLIPATEFFEQSYYTNTGPGSFPAEFGNSYSPSSSSEIFTYWGPNTVNISLPPAPAAVPVGTIYSASTNLSTLLATLTPADGWNVAPGNVITMNNVLYVNNNLIIDVSAEFLNSNYLRFAPGVKVVVNPTITFKVTNSTLAPYCGEIWEGIEHFSGNSSVFIENSNLCGARYGLDAQNGAMLQVTNSRLIENYVGIRMRYYTNASTSIIKGNYFGNASTTAYLLNGTMVEPYAGVVLFRVENLIVGGEANNNVKKGNLFQKLQNGIKGFSSTFASNRNAFHTIKRPSTAVGGYTELEYSAISLNNGVLPLPNSKLTAGPLTEPTNQNAFYNCESGITVTNNASADINFCFMKTMQYRGVHARNVIGAPGALRSLKMTRNRVLTVNLPGTIAPAFAFYVKDYLNTNLLIEWNNINGQQGNFTVLAPFIQVGIYVANTTLTSGFGSSVIQFNTIRQARIAINQRLKRGGLINENTITWNYSLIGSSGTLPGNFKGIWIEYCNNIATRNNLITRSGTGSFTALNHTLMYGIAIEQSNSCEVWKNVMTKCGAGFRAFGSNVATKLQCNEFNTCSFGIRMDLADIGSQGSPTLSAHNVWQGTLVQGTAGTTINHDASNPLNYFRKNPPSFFSDPSGFIVGPLNGNWNDISINSNGTCGNALNKVPLVTMTAVQQREKELGLVVQGVQLYDSLDAPLRKYQKQHAYGRLKHEAGLTSLGTNDAVFQSFVANIDGTPLAAIDQAYEFAALGQFGQADSMRQFYDLTEPDQDLLASIQSLWNTAQSTGIALTPADSAYILDVACMDPLTNGQAVYVARAMMDWFENCISYGAKSVETYDLEEETKFVNTTLFPNPNKGSFTVSSTLEIERIEILDMCGHVVYEQLDHRNSLDFKITLESGIYILKTYLSNHEIETQKMVVE